MRMFKRHKVAIKSLQNCMVFESMQDDLVSFLVLQSSRLEKERERERAGCIILFYMCIAFMGLSVLHVCVSSTP